MANRVLSLKLLLGLLGLISYSEAFAWYDNQWRYRVPISIPSGSGVNSTAKFDVDFALLLKDLGVSGNFDIQSPRVVRSDDLSLVTTQEYTDSIYKGATDALANSRGEVRFILEDNGPATYYLYFDIDANGPKSPNPQQKINGNFEADRAGTLSPTGWRTPSRSYFGMDLEVRPSETVTVGDSSPGALPTSVATDGTPNTGSFSYLMGFRSRSDNIGTVANATLTRDITIPSSNPGNISIAFKPQGWDAGNEGDLSNYDFIQVRLLNPFNSSVVLDVVGPQMRNYRDCPFSPNYGINLASVDDPGYGRYNFWDNETDRNNHEKGLSSAYNRGNEPWVNCKASLINLAGRTVRLEIKMSVFPEYRTWFLLDDVQWSVIETILGKPQALVVNTPPAGFNAFETNTAIDATNGVLHTKIAGSAFAFDVVALTGTPSVSKSFTGAVIVELVDGSGSIGCAARTAIQTVAKSYTFTSSDQGRHTFSGVVEANAYRDVLVRISYPDISPTLVACSSDHFAIRPAYFIAEATDQDWETAGNARVLNATTVSAFPIHKAGKPFTLSITAYNALKGITVGYDELPQVGSVNCVLPSNACILGVFSAGSFVTGNGVAVSNTARYSEVGAVTVIVSDSNFAIIDIADGSSLAERTVVSGAINVGRFVPDHFSVSLNTPIFLPACTSFSYVGQPIKYAVNPVVVASAETADGNVTQNYTGSLLKINLPAIVPNYTAASQPITVLNATTPVPTDNGNGTGTLTFSDTTTNILAFTRGNPVAPFNAEIAMSFTLSDIEGVTTLVSPVTFGEAIHEKGIGFSGGNKTMRWGRLVMQNAYGSELAPLALPLFAEYFNGSSFVKNTADSCSSLTLSSHLALSNPATAGGSSQAGNAVMTIGSGSSQATLTNSTLAAGEAGLSFSAPGSGNTGYIEIGSNFASVPWLLFDWDHDGNHNDSPAARASFGLFNGGNRQIYRREVY